MGTKRRRSVDEWEKKSEKGKKRKKRIKGPYRKAWLGGKQRKYKKR